MASSTTANSSNPANKALMIGIVGIVLTIPGIWVSGGAKLAFAWLTAMTFWTGMAIGMLMLIMIHHIVDASWSTVIRRQFEHGISAFKWLALMFVPLVVASIIEPSILWKYLDPSYDLANVGGHGTVGSDVLWQKKSGLLSLEFFLGLTVVSFLGWILLSNRFRRCSFSQDNDGDIIWTRKSRVWSAVGVPVIGITREVCVRRGG